MARMRLTVISAGGLALLALLAGCAQDAPPKGTAVAASGTPVALPAQPVTPGRGDVETLQQGRRQDAQVINDANKALGVVRP